MFRYPVYQPDLGGNERKYVLECIDSTWISSKGKFIKQFEAAFCSFVGVPYGCSLTNGTVALHAALLALGIGNGDEVIVPSLTYIASVNAIRYTGATPVFADVLPDTWQLDPADVEACITPRTKAIMAVHLYGHPSDLDRLSAIAKARSVWLVEDCAEAIGSKYGTRHVGGIGHVATFSFFGNKTITTGEGGMVVSTDEKLIELVTRIKGQGLAPNREYWHDIVGYNYRMTNICAAIGLAQLERADDIVKRKRRVADWYRDELTGVPVTYHGEYGDVVHSYWMVSVLLPQADQRDPVRRHLAEKGIETRPLFYPAHTMPMYNTGGRSLPVTDDLSGRGINLPSYPDLRREDVAVICSELRSALEALRS
jgi:perosamine synthetase